MSKAFKFFVLVPQKCEYVVERFGRFSHKMEAGLNFKWPIYETIAYQHSLKEQILEVAQQQAITKDNVKIRIDGVLYYRIQDVQKASYSVNRPIEALSLLAQTTMRSEIGKLNLDSTFQERASLNDFVREAVNEAS